LIEKEVRSAERKRKKRKQTDELLRGKGNEVEIGIRTHTYRTAAAYEAFAAGRLTRSLAG